VGLFCFCTPTIHHEEPNPPERAQKTVTHHLLSEAEEHFYL
jgi:hypothetical protein